MHTRARNDFPNLTGDSCCWREWARVLYPSSVHIVDHKPNKNQNTNQNATKKESYYGTNCLNSLFMFEAMDKN